MNTPTTTAPTWGTNPWGDPTYRQPGAGFFDNPPPLDGYRPSFVGRVGVGPGGVTRWTYRKEAT